MKKLYLEQQRNPRAPLSNDLATSHVWAVQRVVGATEPRIYDTLTREQVHYFCAREDEWHVEIK